MLRVASSRMIPPYPARWTLMALLCVAGLAMVSPDAAAQQAAAESDTIAHFRFEADGPQLKTIEGHKPVDKSPGALTAPQAADNTRAMPFDGETQLAHTDFAGNHPGLVSNFTWEGFFYSPAANTYEVDGAIADRFLTQFASSGPGSTRLTIGLAAKNRGGEPYLCVAFSGEKSRHDGILPVTPDVWHHFALVHEADGGAERLTWYLDYQLAGQLDLTGAAAALWKAPGSAPLAIGGRLFEGETVNRGFFGLLDEIRLTARPLTVNEFLRAKNTAQPPTYSREIDVAVYEDLPADFDWSLEDRQPAETLKYEALSYIGLPTRFNERGHRSERHGATILAGAAEMTLPAGDYRFLVRATTDCRLEVDGTPLIDGRRLAGNHPLEAAAPDAPQDYLAEFKADGKPHTFRLLAAWRKGAKPSTGDAIVCYSASGKSDWRLLGHADHLPVSPAAWTLYRGRMERELLTEEPARREVAIERGNQKWRERHQRTRELAAQWEVPQPPADGNPIDAFVDAALKNAGIHPPGLIDDAAFLRRVTLDITGRIPTLEELQAFLNDDSPNKRERLIDTLLASPEWADHWVGYWQDVLAENPSILKPTLNNSGPFRRWIHESFLRNIPMDRFATELILMEGSDAEGGTAGFAIASQNDAPMAMKAHVVMQAFLAVNMQCARCHDSPTAPLTQGDLFSLAAMLQEQPIKLPATSVVPPLPGGRQAAVSTSLRAGDLIHPAWTLVDLLRNDAAQRVSQIAPRPRAELAEIITSASDPRFSDVLVNRVWRRYFGQGFVEPVDDWDAAAGGFDLEYQDLHRYLSWWFVEHNYDVKALARLIFLSQAYQRQAVDDGAPMLASTESLRWALPSRRRLTAEQIVDSIHTAVGKPFDAEELTFDPNRTRGFLNLGVPHRAWQMTSMSNERDRPALSMPVNQSIVDVLVTFGWRETRPDPQTIRDHEPNPLQPLMLANGLLVSRALRLTEDSQLTELCLSDVPVDRLVEQLFLVTLARRPDAAEAARFSEFLSEGYASRRTGKPKPPPFKKVRARVDWDKHLDAEASVELLEAEKLVREGEPPTVRLTPEFRERVEDAVWAMLNSPEFVFIP